MAYSTNLIEKEIRKMEKFKTYNVYSFRVKNYLKAVGFDYLATGFNDKTGNKFWIFIMTPELQTAIDNYPQFRDKFSPKL